MDMLQLAPVDMLLLICTLGLCRVGEVSFKHVCHLLLFVS